MKNCTDIEQSKKLAELGIDEDTADMNYCNSSYKGKDYVGEWTLSLSSPKFAKTMLGMSVTDWNTCWEVIPAWSLTSLLSVIPYNVTFNKAVYRFKLVKFSDHWECYHENFGTVSTEIFKADNPVDACYEMIVKLHEQKLL